MQHNLTRRTTVCLLLAILFLLECSYRTQLASIIPLGTSISRSTISVDKSIKKNSKVRIAKVSMLYGSPNPVYEKALESHKHHAERWGYPMKVLQQDMVGGFWNKPSYLLSLVIEELAKSPSKRVEWLMWVDADSIILNPAIPAGTFLPPADIAQIHMVSSRDHNGLNTGIVFFHVHPWTVDFLVEVLGHRLYLPEIDLGVSADQEAMARVLKKSSDGLGQSYRDGNVYLPRPWINTYQFHHAYEGKRGDMLVHFPGLDDDRWPHMSKWLTIVESTPHEWEIPLEKTDYPEKMGTFWKQYRAATNIIKATEQEIKQAPSGVSTSARSTAIMQLKLALQEHADEQEVLKQRLDDLYAAVKKETEKT